MTRIRNIVLVASMLETGYARMLEPNYCKLRTLLKDY